MTNEQPTTETPKTENKTLELNPPAPPNLCDAELIELLGAEPILCLQLKAALAGGRWLVTIHARVKDSPPDDLQAHAVRNDFPIVDVTGALQAICRSILTDGAAELGRQQTRILDSRTWR
ncbi:MAG TPA: hypothetical protein VMY42_11405 [Thermoguttaceae bacterium]|nr:hypothetical protein [Thermoguttaceae bacterium]